MSWPRCANFPANRGISGRAFWSAAAKLVSADIAVLLLGHPGQTPQAGPKSANGIPAPARRTARTEFTSHLEPIAERCLGGNFVEQTDAAGGMFHVAVRLKLAQAGDELIFAAQLKDFTEDAARESLVRLRLAADVPAAYQLESRRRQKRTRCGKIRRRPGFQRAGEPGDAFSARRARVLQRHRHALPLRPRQSGLAGGRLRPIARHEPHRAVRPPDGRRANRSKPRWRNAWIRTRKSSGRRPKA